ncbi:hypothetical protein GGQ84_001526 [Desulfitispora alkaliphila]|uniref:hypothetical protein n=1 Tax=Desulfitispora alkaliphila TaxID=622674 RepID=UPI003D260767
MADEKGRSSKFTIRGFEIDIDHDYLSSSDSMDILKELYKIKHDTSLSDQEKASKVQQVMNKYVK